MNKERFTARRTADNYYREWREERKEKENLMVKYDEQKEFQLPPNFYLDSKSLETDCDNSAEIGSGAFGSVVLRTFKGRVVAVKLMVNSQLEENNQRRVVVKEAVYQH